jgi:hypothetical protein
MTTKTQQIIDLVQKIEADLSAADHNPSDALREDHIKFALENRQLKKSVENLKEQVATLQSVIDNIPNTTAPYTLPGDDVDQGESKVVAELTADRDEWRTLALQKDVEIFKLQQERKANASKNPPEYVVPGVGDLATFSRPSCWTDDHNQVKFGCSVKLTDTHRCVGCVHRGKS